MRRAHVLAGATVLPALLLGACSGRPNDLYTYYDDPTGTSAAAPSAEAKPQPRRAAPPSSTGSSPARRVERAALTAADLAEEQVTPGDPAVAAVRAALPDCAAPLDSGPDAAAGTSASWQYASGSVLRQYVAAYPADAEAVVRDVRAAVDCATFRAGTVTYTVDRSVPVPPVSGVDDQVTWCATSAKLSTCTLVLARQGLLTVVSVEAATVARARSAVGRIAPTAGEALGRA